MQGHLLHDLWRARFSPFGRGRVCLLYNKWEGKFQAFSVCHRQATKTCVCEGEKEWTEMNILSPPDASCNPMALFCDKFMPFEKS
jgi:hypothetical protein